MLNREIWHPNTHLPVEKQPQVNTWKQLYISNAKWAGNINKTKQKLALNLWCHGKEMTVWNTEVALQYDNFIISPPSQQKLLILSIPPFAGKWWSMIICQITGMNWTIIFKETPVSLFKKEKEKYLMLIIEKSIFQGGVANMFFQLQKFLQSYLFSQWQIKYVRLVQVLFFFLLFIRAVLEY